MYYRLDNNLCAREKDDKCARYDYPILIVIWTAEKYSEFRKFLAPVLFYFIPLDID